MQYEAASLGCTIQDEADSLCSTMQDMTIGESQATPGNGVPPQATEDAARVLVVEDAGVTFLRTVRTDGMRLSEVPDDLKTYSLCMAAVANHAGALKFVPEAHKTEELILTAIEAEDEREDQDRVLLNLPDHLKSAKICDAAVRVAGIELEFVPPETMTPELCMEAVTQDAHALEYVPEELRTKQMCEEAVTHLPFVLEHVPDAYRTPKMYTNAVRGYGGLLEDVPMRERTEQMCVAAVAQNGLVLEIIPEEDRTATICHIAVAENGCALSFVPTHIVTEQLCVFAISNNGNACSHVTAAKKVKKELNMRKILELATELIYQNARVAWGSAGLDPDFKMLEALYAALDANDIFSFPGYLFVKHDIQYQLERCQTNLIMIRRDLGA